MQDWLSFLRGTKTAFDQGECFPNWRAFRAFKFISVHDGALRAGSL